MTQVKTFSTYSKKKSLKTLSRTVFLKELPKQSYPTQESDVELDDVVCETTHQLEIDPKNDSGTLAANLYYSGSENETKVSPRKESDFAENCALGSKQEEESPPKKRNTGRRVLNMKSNSISRSETISDGMCKVSLKAPERTEVKATAPVARNVIHHTVNKVSNTYASIARSYVEANETYSISEAQRAKQEGLESSDDEDDQQLKIHELKEAGAMRRFHDQMVYIFDGIMSQVINIQKASLSELIDNMKSEGFLIRLRSSDWLIKIFDGLIHVPDEGVKHLMVFWLEIIVQDLRSARTLNVDLVESLILNQWKQKVSNMNSESNTTDSKLLSLTYWILKAQDSTNQKLSNTMVQSLEIVCNPISRWIDSTHQKLILECIEMCCRMSNQASDVITVDVLEFVMQMFGNGFEPKICLNILVDYSWECDNITCPTLFMNVDFVQTLLKYSFLATKTNDDPLELSLNSVEILVSLIASRSKDFIKILESLNLRDILDTTSTNVKYDLHLFLLDILQPHVCENQDEASLYAANVMFLTAFYAHKCLKVKSELLRRIKNLSICRSLLEEFMEFKRQINDTLGGLSPHSHVKVLAALKTAINVLQ